MRGGDGLLRTLTAEAVVTASGGFEGNSEMRFGISRAGATSDDLARHSEQSRRGNPGNGGRGRADTASSMLPRRAGRPSRDEARRGLPHTYGILVNRQAQRFFDEDEQLRLHLRGPRIRRSGATVEPGRVPGSRPDQPPRHGSRRTSSSPTRIRSAPRRSSTCVEARPRRGRARGDRRPISTL